MISSNVQFLLKKASLFVIAYVLLVACSSRQNLYRNKSQSSEVTVAELQEVDTRFFLVGNAGATKSNFSTKVLAALQDEFKGASESDYLIFLGDNVHDNNMDKMSNIAQYNAQLDVAAQFKGTSLFIPGEHDWHEEEVKGIEVLENYTEDYLDREDPFLPKNGCPLEVIDVNEGIALFLIDSQWYIEDWSKMEDINKKCQLKTREQFLTLLADEVRKARHKTVVLAMHHPVYTNGIYGGEVPLEAIYKPIPENIFLPGIGTLWSFLRSQGGISKQDQHNPLMNNLMKEVALIVKQAPRVLVASAHERNLQFISHPFLKQVVSGAATKTKAARLGKDGLFSSGSQGFSVFTVYKDGSSHISFKGVNDADKVEALYEQKVFDAPIEYPVDSLPTVFPKQVTSTIYPQEYVAKDATYERLWGKHYRYLYGVPVTAPVALLDTLHGGLRVERAGGGNQTLSLRLVTKDDKEYNMRALSKDPIAFLKSAGYNDLDANRFFSETIPADLIKDFYTAAHPYAAFAIPRLAGAIDVNHTHPKLYYVPRQKTLGNFNATHGDRLYMIVEKPDDDFEGSHMFGVNDDVESTLDLFEELREDEENQLDERAYIRARIFDILIGDWDRHEDQWRWSQRKMDSTTTLYHPIPRDRDQVFANFDGAILETLQKFMGGTRQFGKYGPDIEFIEGFSESAINLDRALLQNISIEDWLEEVEIVQRKITPEVVRKAFAEMPKEVQDSTSRNIQRDLLARKQNLPEIIKRYYANYSRFQTLKGTNEEDLFQINQKQDGTVNITGYRVKKDGRRLLLFDRTFTAAQTEDIWIYGLDDEDVFEVSGERKSDIRIALIGGLGDDTYQLFNAQNIKVFDQKAHKNNIKNKGGARFIINDIYESRIYDTERRPSSASVKQLSIPYIYEYGVSPRIYFAKRKLNFQRNPFTSMYSLDVQYLSLIQAVDLQLGYHIGNVLPEWNVALTGRITSANFTQNFFGFGNNTALIESLEASRVALQFIETGLHTYYDGEYGSSFKIGLFYKDIDVDNTIVANENVALSTVNYVSVDSKYVFKSVDDEVFTTRGMYFELDGSYLYDIAGTTAITKINPLVSFWNAIDSSRNLVLHSSAGGQMRFGEEVPFHQAAQLGGEHSLRSYRLQRFTGQYALRGRVDLFYKFQPLKTKFFPVRIQAYGGSDVGRVWVEGEDAQTYHYSLGGGIKLGTADILTSTVSYFTGPEGGRFAFALRVGL